MTKVTSYTIGNTTSFVLTVKGSVDALNEFKVYSKGHKNEMNGDTLKVQVVVEANQDVFTGKYETHTEMKNRIARRIDITKILEMGLTIVSFK